MAPRPKAAQPNNGEKDDDEAYRMKRDRNNIAVKKSREKSRQKARETSDRIVQLREENSELELRIDELSNQLNLLKKTLLEHVGAGVRKNSQKLSTTTAMSSDLSDGSESKPALADPKTVSRDHEYTGLKKDWKSPVGHSERS